METIKEAKEYVNIHKNKGVNCPCCEQYAKIYNRKLNSGMAYGLLIMYKLHKKNGFERFLKMNEEITKLGIPSSNVEYPKLAYWGLIEEMPNDNKMKKTSGYWKITEKGKLFALNYSALPSHAVVYNTKVIGFSETTTTIDEALNNKFNYTELMNF